MEKSTIQISLYEKKNKIRTYFPDMSILSNWPLSGWNTKQNLFLKYSIGSLKWACKAIFSFLWL